VPKAAPVTEPTVTNRKVTRGRILRQAHRRLPDIEQAAAAFMAADLPWLAPEARDVLAATPEVYGRPDGKVLPPPAKRVRR
jgi:hypothetical protein